MNSLNRAMIIGNITRDLEIRQTKNGQAVCTVGVATNRTWKDATGEKREEAEYHNVICWGRLAEICAEYLKKGSKVFFSGHLRTRSWEDEAGTKRYRTEIVAEDMIMLSPKGSVSGGGNFSGGDLPDIDGSPAMPETSASEGEEEVSAEDLPF